MKSFFERYEKLIPFLLFFLFLALIIPGTAQLWNPDELVNRVNNALHGNWVFDETNFDYPSLPKYVMFGIGKVVYGLGASEHQFYQAARVFSAFLGALIVVLVYFITRNMGGSIFTSLLAALFTFSNSEFSMNARFAHNDMYLVFFILLSVHFLVLYKIKAQKGWLYAAFISVGMAASSKYNGGVFILMPVLLFLWATGKDIWRQKLAVLETLFIGAVLSFLGYAAGTPKALFWMAYYFKRMLPALAHHASYGQLDGSMRGVWGQWGILSNAMGGLLFLLFMAAFLYFVIRFFLGKTKNEQNSLLLIPLLGIFIFDLPIMLSYNYQARFFLSLLPLFSILAALFIAEISEKLAQSKYSTWRKLLPAAALLLVAFGLLRVTSITLLVKNDPRIEAGEFIETLPAGTSLEYTMYPPLIPEEHFEREYSYPIFFTKFLGQEVPDMGPGKPKLNQGEAGLLERKTDYFVLDSFTYARCSNEAIYETNPVECAFFRELLAGETSYQMIGDFQYELPKFLPQISIAFVNPKVHVFERVE